MTHRERVRAALQHRPPDHTPYHIGFTVPARAHMAAYYGDPAFEQKLGNCLTPLSTEPANGWREVAPDIWEDQFGVRWNRTVDKDIGVVCNRVVPTGDLNAFHTPDPADPTRYRDYPAARDAEDGRFLIANLGFSLFERAWTLVGMEDLLAAMVLDPPFVHRLLDRILEFNLGIIERACAHDIDAMMFGDDWGQQSGLIMGRRRWREYILPRVREMYGRAKAHGKFVFIHSCGKVDELFPDLIEAGLDAFNPFQPEVIDVCEAKRRYGDRLAFYGGISTQRTLPYATPAQVRDEVRRLRDVVGENGGLIAAPAHDIPADARPENIAAMIEALQEG